MLDDQRKRWHPLPSSDPRSAGALDSRVPTETAADDATLPQSLRVGDYELRHEIGRGGMGSVWSAVRADDPAGPRVALKLIKRGLDSDAILERFRHERALLAGLDHPNIPRWLGGGSSDDGRPFFVMELIEGQSLSDWAPGRDLAARLEIFLGICAAVHYAHQNLIVHRDLKPANVLVTPDGVPKLLDFGIAALVDPAGLAQTVVAGPGARRLMTPAYASPEQLRGEAVTTASDVYSLGVLLYELVADRRPYDVAGLDHADVLRVVCEQPTLRPSLAVVQTAGARPTVLAERRRRQLEGDLDNIVLMALRKEPARRYASVAQLADDIRRYQQGQPVVARQDTLRYRASKFVRRHRVAVAAGLVCALALVGGSVGIALQAREARLQRARAERRFEDVRRLATAFLFEFHSAIEALPGSLPARELVVRRALEYLASLAQEADTPELKLELAEAYRKVGDVQGNPYFANLGNSQGALASYRSALGLDAAAAAALGSAEATLALSTDHNKVGDMLALRGDADGALASHRRSLELVRTIAQPDARSLRRLYVAETKLGEALSASGDRKAARTSFEAALGTARALAESQPGVRLAQRDLSVALVNLCDVQAEAGDGAGALDTCAQALALRQALAASDTTSGQARYDVAAVLDRLATLRAGAGDLAAALAAQRQALALVEGLLAADARDASARRVVAISEAAIGQLQLRLGQPREALASHQRALAHRQALLAADPGNAAVRGEKGDSHAAIALILATLQRPGACAEAARAREAWGPGGTHADAAAIAALAARCGP